MRITAIACAVLFLHPYAGGMAQPRIEVLRWLDKSSPLLAFTMRAQPGLSDFDRDDIPDIVILSSAGVFTCTGVNGQLWEFDAGAAGLVDPQFLGFLRLTATSGPATHAAFIEQEALYLVMLNNKHPENTKFEFANTQRPHALGLRQRASGVDVAIVAANDRIAVIGAVAGVRGTVSPMNKQARPTVTAYTLTEKFIAEAEEGLGYDPDLYPLAGEMDFDSDGIDDLGILISDTNGIPVGIAVHDGNSLDERWRWEIPAQYLERVMMGMHGFADVDGDGKKELYCGDNLVVFQDGTVREIRDNFRTRHLMDVDRDGLPDVIGRDLATGRLIALGSTTATAVENIPSAEAMHLLPAHPHPMISGSVISFSLDRPLSVRLAIHDMHGRRVRTLTDGIRDAGVHRFDFDGTDATGVPLPSGGYSIILTSATAQQRHGIIIIR